MDIKLDGRTAIITGGSAGIGKAIAQKFVLSGANVAMRRGAKGKLDQSVNDIVKACEIAPGCPSSIKAISADICSAEECAKIVALPGRIGNIDILINNAVPRK